MRRTLAILCFLAGISLAPITLHAQSVDAAQQEFVNAFLSARKAEDMEKSGDVKAALSTYRSVAGMLTRIKQSSPNWNADLVDFRLKRTMDAIDRLQGMMGAGRAAPGSDGGVLPPLPTEDPLAGGSTPPPRGKPSTGGAAISGDDPLAAVKTRITNLESQLSEANDRLREEREKNEKLTKDISAAMDARKKAEDSRKKAQDLADLYQKNVLELKSKGDTNSDRVKELEAKLAEVNRATLDTQAELAAAEERISQLLSRSQEMQKIVVSAGSLPQQVKDLEAKLAAEQQTTAQQMADAKKREDDLKNQIAMLTKENKNVAAMPAEVKALQAKLAAEQKASADAAEKAKKREEDLKGQIASLTKEKNDAQAELVRLRELNKQTDKLMTENASLLKKLADAEKQVLAFKSGTNARDTEVMLLRKQVTEAQKALTASNDKNATLQTEIGELQKKVADYSKQIAQFKADKTASAEERKKMEDENRLLQGIVMRVLQEDANRAQKKKLIQSEMARLQIQSDVLLQQISYLTQPVVKLSSAERRLLKNPILTVQDPNALVAVKTDVGTAENIAPAVSPPPLATNTTPAATPGEAPKTGDLPPLPPDNSTPAPTMPDTAKPPADTAKVNTPPNNDLPMKDPETKMSDTKRGDVPPGDAKPDQVGATPSVASVAGAKLPDSVKPIAEEAKKYFDKEKFAEAEKQYDKALQLEPNNVYLLSNRAVAQFRSGKYKQAEESFKKALAISPDDAFCWSTLGIVYYSEEKYDEAVNALTKSLAINSKNPTAHNYLGITAAQKGWIEAAQKELETAVQLDPKYSEAWFNLAVTHTLKQPPAKDDARLAYTKAVELGADKDPAMEEMLKQ